MLEQSGIRKPSSGAPGWMCTFADLMSLLLCFFVLLLSFSVMNNQRYKVVAGSMRDAFGVQKKTEQGLSTRDYERGAAIIEKQIVEEVTKEIEAGQIEIAEKDGIITMRVRDALMFDLGKAELKPGFVGLLDRIGPILVNADADLAVHGHTDNLPIRETSVYRSNWGLSTARAVAVTEYLAVKFAIPSHRLTAAGFADGRPVESNGTEAGRAKNRRVEFNIQPKQGGGIVDGIDLLNNQPVEHDFQGEK